MKNETKKRIKNFTIELIDFFLGIPKAFVGGFDRNEFYRLTSGYSSEKELTCSNIAHLISNFKRRGYIEVKKTDRGESIMFTNKAKLAVIDKLTEKICNGKKLSFVSFDIPESLRLQRDQFRRAIKRMGFVQVQKSLWVSNRNLGEFVDMATEEYCVSEYVVYLIVEATNIDDFLKSKMKIAI